MGVPWGPKGPDDLDEDQRARIRYQVLSSLRGRTPTLSDRLYDSVAVAALPAPYLVRALVGVALALAVVATATLVSADSLPEDLLYSMKVTAEDVRLALAVTPGDRAAVELSMAEHRLAEAESLALGGRVSEALVATSAYGDHLANAAAALATMERLDPSAGPIVDRLRERLALQQQRAAAVLFLLASDPTALGAGAVATFETIASDASLGGDALTLSAQIADHAASVAELSASEADRIAHGRPAPTGGAGPADATGAPAGRTTSPTRAPSLTPLTQVSAAQVPQAAPPQATAAGPSITPTAAPTIDPRVAQEAAEKAKREAEKAREAADKAKAAGKKTPAPTPRH